LAQACGSLRELSAPLACSQ